MKQSLVFKSLAVLGLALLTFQACKKEKTYELQSLVAGGVDLNGATSAVGVDAKADIVATFSEAVDAASATGTNITLVRDYDNATIATTISVVDNAVTINPNEDLGSGTLYKLTFSGSVKYADGAASVTTFSRTFTTAGTFAPAGAVAHWTFEGNGEDVAGSYDASAVVSINFDASRNANAGKAATFNGDNSIIEVPNGDKLMNTSDFTMSFWVKANSDGHVNADGNPAGHFVMGLAAFYGFQFEITSDYSWCKLAARYDLGNNTTGSEDLWFPGNGQTYANGGWTRQGIMYMNGEKMKSFDFDLWPDGDAKRGVTGLKYGGTAPETVNELAFGFIQSRSGQLWDTEPWGGYDFPTSNHFKGQLDDVRIYHKVLTDKEIELMYNSEK
ncbi:MAG: Ig-like domain-containing protein [Saprospiraceae bacterium]|nr:Ig-like domain-containing protein [Saprospiraceae bacterium]